MAATLLFRLVPLLLLGAAPRASSAGGAGGAQGYAEAIKSHTARHGAPAHPLHAGRETVRTGNSGRAPFRVGGENTSTQAFSHFFEMSVGSGHMSLTLREDWRTHIRMAARDLGVKHIRGHGLLDDDMSVSYAYGKHAFYNVDSLVDVLMSVGMRPIFELSFMPDWLTSGNHTVCHYKGNSDPPKNYSQWGELIGALGSHMVSKYGEATASEMLFEVWNEPNDNFWHGGEDGTMSKQEAYFELYTHAARALKAASPKLRVGGPATCCANCWIDDFVRHMDNASVPYDFVSTHAYSSCQMTGLGDATRVVKEIQAARAILDNVTAAHPKPWLITEFGASCNQGFGNPDSPQFPSAIHDMIDQSSYTIKAVDELAGPGEPQALSYWAVSDVFEESFFPVHNESFHGMFGLINLHGVPKPSYRAYQLLHETGDTRWSVAGPTIPPAPTPQGTCGTPVNNMDVWGGDVAPTVTPCPTCGLLTLADCCDLCIKQNKIGAVCDTAELWHPPENGGGNATHGYRCGLKQFSKRTNITANPGRTYVRVEHRAPIPPPTDDELCAMNAGVLAVANATAGHLDLLLYNHAAFDFPIVDCNLSVSVLTPPPQAAAAVAALLGLDRAITAEEVAAAEAAHWRQRLARGLASATVRRIDESHANPLAAWIAMGAPDYTNSSQNAALLTASELQVEKLREVAISVGVDSFELAVPTHGVAAVRVPLLPASRA